MGWRDGRIRFWGKSLAKLVKMALWAAAGVALVWAIYYLVRRLPHLIEPEPARARAAARAVRPRHRAGDPARPISPEPPRDLLGEGRVREALSLLYRGALSSLVHAKGVALSAGDTERDCLRRARAVLPREGHAYFGRADRGVGGDRLRRTLCPTPGRAQGLVASWPAHFVPAPG